MIKIPKIVIIAFLLFKSSRALFELGKCILPNTWTGWEEQGTCGEITQKRSYKYYMCEFWIYENHSVKTILKARVACLSWFSEFKTGHETDRIQKSPCRK